MILYHGTSSKYLDQILSEGIQPRCITGRESLWEGDVQSKEDLVYLTSAYAIYFAMNIDEGEPLILQVDADELELFPDEDFVAFHLAHANGTDWKQTIPTVNPRDYQHHWEDSLRLNGNVAVNQVPPESILDHRVIPGVGNEHLLMAIGADAMPTQLNFSFKGKYYQNCLDSLFENELEELTAIVHSHIERFEREEYGDEGYEEQLKIRAEIRRLNEEARKKGISSDDWLPS